MRPIRAYRSAGCSAWVLPLSSVVSCLPLRQMLISSGSGASRLIRPLIRSRTLRTQPRTLPLIPPRGLILPRLIQLDGRCWMVV